MPCSSWLARLASLGMVLTAAAFCKQAINMMYYIARLDDCGVDFRFGSRKNIRDYFFAWAEIAAVRHRKTVDSTYYVVAKDKFALKFTIYTFFRPKKLARVIAARIDQKIEEA